MISISGDQEASLPMLVALGHPFFPNFLFSPSSLFVDKKKEKKKSEKREIGGSRFEPQKSLFFSFLFFDDVTILSFFRNQSSTLSKKTAKKFCFVFGFDLFFFVNMNSIRSSFFVLSRRACTKSQLSSVCLVGRPSPLAGLAPTSAQTWNKKERTIFARQFQTSITQWKPSVCSLLFPFSFHFLF